MRPRTPLGPESVSTETIVAVATAPGESAIGVVRASGPSAVSMVATLVRGRRPLAFQPSHTVRRVDVIDGKAGTLVDQALCTVMRAPHSYTGEDVVELSCHGSPAVLRLVVERLVEQGARLARPGEFTRRALLNGRLDLAQVEAVALLIGARTARAASLAARTLAGALSAPMGALRERLLDIVAGLEVTLDFPEEAVGLDAGPAAVEMERLAEEAARWLAAARRGHAVHGGVRVALVGAPNAGKSTLLNAMLGQERAIVSPLPGTTRDVVEGTIELGGVPVRLLDTAGLDVARDVLAEEAMRRTRAAIDESDAVVIVVDGSKPPPRVVVEGAIERPGIVVLAKSDLVPDPASAALPASIRVSARTGAGVAELVERLTALVTAGLGVADEEEGIVASIRHIEALGGLETALRAAATALRTAPVEAALVDAQRALREASAVMGIDVGDDVLDRVFARFCLGK